MNTLITPESYTAVKTICSEVRKILTNYKYTGILYEAQIKKLEEEIRFRLASERINNIFELEELLMKKLQQFRKNYKEDKFCASELNRAVCRVEYVIDEYCRQKIFE